jgi:nitrogen fixation NifU-like protein
LIPDGPADGRAASHAWLFLSGAMRPGAFARFSHMPTVPMPEIMIIKRESFFSFYFNREEPPMMYSKTVMDHFRNPRNVGVIEDANGVGEVGNPLCGDIMTIYLKIVDDRIDDIKFQTFGCGSAIAVSSMLTEIAKGKTIAEAKTITNKDVAEALEGLPKNKLHCSNLGADALQMAIKNYEDGVAGITRPEEGNKEVHVHEEGGKCYCPYCDVEIQEGVTFCEACQSDLEEEH